MERNGLSNKEAGMLGQLKSQATRKQNLLKRISDYNNNPKLCNFCQKPLEYLHRFNKFCNKSCAASFKNTNRVLSKETKDKIRTSLLNRPTHTTTCDKCGNIFETTSYKQNIKCPECKIKYCKVCGQETCIHKNICKKYSLFPSLIKYFNFNKSYLGTIDVYKEYNRIKEMLEKDYYDDQLSIELIKQKYNIDKDISGTWKLLKSIGINIRSLSEAARLTLLHNRTIIPNVNNYKHRLSHNVG